MEFNVSVSIITACYNSEKYLDDTITSILQQTYSDWEWIIVDDCSTDKSIDVIKKYNDSRIKLIQLNKNVGAAIARNHGLEAAKGRFISFIDSDDLWTKDALEKRVSFLLNTNEEIVYTSYKRLDEDLNPYLNDFIAEDNITFNRLLYNCPISNITLVYDSKNIGKIPFPNAYRREDYAMILNLLKATDKKARALKEPLSIYRIRKNSYSRNKWLMFKQQFLVYYNFLELSLLKSLYFTLNWAFNGLKKYGGI